MEKTLNQLEDQAEKLKNKHNHALELWNAYDDSLKQVQENIQQAEYATSRGKVVMGSVSSLHAQAVKLKVRYMYMDMCMYLFM